MCISRRALKTLVTISLLFGTTNSSAIPTYLDQWRDFYPDSKSADIRCQLCHVRRDGGDPWNAYGNDIRAHFNSLDPTTRTIEDAFEFVQSLNSDGDDPATTNITEINADSQPGWREGRVNIAYDRNGFSAGVFFPPVTVDPFPEKIETQAVSLELVDVASGFTAPVGAVSAPVSALRKQLFVIDQTGIIWRVDLDSGEKTEFIDVQSRLVALGAFSPGGYDERGLLGLAFHPQFASNGRVYIHTSEPVAGSADFSTLSGTQTANHQGVISEITIANPTDKDGSAIISSQREILRVDQPQFNHNGGDLVFDHNGLLYIGLGDGGGADDQGVGHGENGNGADPSNPFGAILRIDPLGNNSGNGAYGIPSDNPFINDDSIVDEIFAYGFRNPWKLSFGQNNTLYAADVGQNDIEEVNVVEKGQHYGWRLKEGRFFFDANDEFSGILTFDVPANLPSTDLIDPILQYDHDEGISVIGGYQYRGQRNQSLRNKYIFADFQSRLFIGDLDDGSVKSMDLSPDIFIFGLAQDQSGELYFIGNQNATTSGSTGKLVKLQSTIAIPEDLCFPVKTNNGKIAIICL